MLLTAMRVCATAFVGVRTLISISVNIGININNNTSSIINVSTMNRTRRNVCTSITLEFRTSISSSNIFDMNASSGIIVTTSSNVRRSISIQSKIINSIKITTVFRPVLLLLQV